MITSVLGTNTDVHILFTAGSDACQPHRTLAEAVPGTSSGLSNGIGALAIKKKKKVQEDKAGGARDHRLGWSPHGCKGMRLSGDEEQLEG